MSEQEIVGLNIPTGRAPGHELGDQLPAQKHYYLGDPEAVRKAAEAVARQGKGGYRTKEAVLETKGYDPLPEARPTPRSGGPTPSTPTVSSAAGPSRWFRSRTLLDRA